MLRQSATARKEDKAGGVGGGALCRGDVRGDAHVEPAKPANAEAADRLTSANRNHSGLVSGDRQIAADAWKMKDSIDPKLYSTGDGGYVDWLVAVPS